MMCCPPGDVRHLANSHNQCDGWFRVAPEQAGKWTIALGYDDYIGIGIDDEWLVKNTKVDVARKNSWTAAAGWHKFKLVFGDTGDTCGNRGKTRIPYAVTVSINGGEWLPFNDMVEAAARELNNRESTNERASAKRVEPRKETGGAAVAKTPSAQKPAAAKAVAKPAAEKPASKPAAAKTANKPASKPAEPKPPVEIKLGRGQEEYKGRTWKYYVWNENKVEIESISDCSGVVEFPKRLGGVKVTSITKSLCSERKEMTGVALPDGLTEIEDDAFYECTGLGKVALPGGLKSLGCGAFEKCSNLTGDFDLRGLTNVGARVFKECPRVTSVILPEDMTKLDNYLFEGCSNLTTVTIPRGVTHIASSVFAECTSFKGELDIPDGVTEIEYAAFRNCSGFTSVKIPAGVSKFGDSVFQGCSGIAKFDVPKGLDKISEFMFAGCTAMTSFDMPKGVKRICAAAFSSCSNLTEIALPANLEKLENWAFKEAVKLKSVDVPASVEEIGPYAFAVCSSLKGVTLHEGLKRIGKGAFRDCASLEEITIPASVEKIEAEAFAGCTSLKNVVFLGKKPRILQGTFKGCPQALVDKLEPKPPKLPEGYGSVKTKTKTVTLPGGATMEMIYCPPGTYMMGTPEGMKKGASSDTEGPIKVTLTKGFWLGKYEVTKKQWKSVMGEQPEGVKYDGDDMPAECISWVRADEFCKKVGGGARLPTEAEWEYACRAGAPTAFPWGNTCNGTQINCDGTSPFSYEEDENKIPHGPKHEGPVKVGSYKPNAWGFHDMNGNVIEWCQDWFKRYWARDTELTDPQGEEERHAMNKVLRGGSWNLGAWACTNSARFSEDKNNRAGRGFRMAMSE